MEDDTVIKCPNCGTLWDGRFMEGLYSSCSKCGTECIKMKKSEEKDILGLIESTNGSTGAGPNV